jgi:uncharacterized protein YndB with AHSA1/START domain
MKKLGEIIAPGTIRFERILPGPIERVWSYLTDSEKRGQWLAKGKMELRVGGKVELHFFHADLSPIQEPIPEKYKDMENGGKMEGEITQIEPPYLLSYTWGEASGEASVVSFELKQEENQVKLTLTHRRLGDDSDLMISVASGWHTHLGILMDNLRGKQPKGFWEVHNQMEVKYQELLNLSGNASS